MSPADKVEIAFNKFDLDNDGYLSWEEFQQVSEIFFPLKSNMKLLRLDWKVRRRQGYSDSATRSDPNSETPDNYKWSFSEEHRPGNLGGVQAGNKSGQLLILQWFYNNNKVDEYQSVKQKLKSHIDHCP